MRRRKELWKSNRSRGPLNLGPEVRAAASYRAQPGAFVLAQKYKNINVGSRRGKKWTYSERTTQTNSHETKAGGNGSVALLGQHGGEPTFSLGF